MKKLSWLLGAVCLVLVLSLIPMLLHPLDHQSEPDSPQLTVWGWDDTIPAAFEQYALSHPGVSLNYITVEKSDYLRRLKLAVALNEPLPDLCILENETLSEIAQLDLFVDLQAEPYHLNPEELLDFRMHDLQDEQGHLWGVPAIPSAGGLAYSRAQAQSFLNTDDPVQVSVAFNSWADVIARGRQFRRQYPDKALFASLEDVAVMMFGQTRQPYIMDGSLKDAWRFLNYFKILDALQEEQLTLDYQQYSPQWLNSFETGQVFFYPCPLWLIQMGVFHDTETWGLTSAPSGSYSWGGTAWAIPHSSTQKELAWDFMKTILLSPAGAMYNKNKENGTFISYRPAYSMDGYQDLILSDFGGQNIGQIYFDRILPESPAYAIGEQGSVVKETYLSVVRALTAVPELDAQSAFGLFLSRLKEELPELKIEETE